MSVKLMHGDGVMLFPRSCLLIYYFFDKISNSHKKY